jgi:radical SAM superfamily enzyme YgiQ (UPF0313 family)
MGETKTRRIARVACVQLEPRYPDFCSRVIMPRYGLPVIGAVLQREGYEVRVFIEHVAPVDRDWVLQADVVLLSALTGAATRTYEFADWFRRHSDAPIVMGGEHASSFANDSLEWVDFVIRREGDAIILPLLRALEEGGPFDAIPGLRTCATARWCTTIPARCPTTSTCGTISASSTTTPRTTGCGY